jgi:hypothetical protein
MDAGQRELVLTPQRSIRTYANPRESLWNSYAIGARSVSLLYGIPAIFAEQAAPEDMRRDMLFVPKHDLNTLEANLRGAQAITAELMFGVMTQACVRCAAMSRAAQTRVNQLIEAGAWTDAALALLELELPQWKLRRLVQEDGEWLCTLSKQPQLPLGLDEVSEATHEVLPLAILIALLHARCAPSPDAASSTAVPVVRPTAGYALNCDNFA